MSSSKQSDPFFSHHKVTNFRKTTGIHFHDEYELYYLLNGKTKYFIGDEIFLLEQGNLVLVPARMLHSCDSEDCLFNERLLLSFSANILDKTVLPLLHELEQTKLIALPPEKLYIVDELFQRIQKEYAKERKHKQLLLELYVSELITILCRLKSDYVPHVSPTDKIIYDIADYIRTHFDQPLPLSDFSRLFPISQGYLSRKFKAVTGVGLNDFITHVRITQAEKLLSGTTLSVAEVAGRCGFNDSNYFAAVFKKLKGITPYKYAKRAETPPLR